MNSEKFKEKFIRFIMKKWTCPTVCGICILLIFAMSANSFAKYYTRIQAERAASVAIFGSDLVNAEQFWTKGYTTASGVSGFVTDTSEIKESNIKDGCVRVYLGKNDNDEVDKKLSINYHSNKAYRFNITNNVNGKICEVALSYTITVEFPDTMPKGVTWNLRLSNSDETAITDISNLTTKELQYSDQDYYKLGRNFSSPTFTLAAGVEEIDTYVIQFSGETIDYGVTDRFYDDMKITVTTTQITK